MKNYNVLKFIHTWSMISFDNTERNRCRIIIRINIYIAKNVNERGFLFFVLHVTLPFLILQINASIM